MPNRKTAPLRSYASRSRGSSSAAKAGNPNRRIPERLSEVGPAAGAAEPGGLRLARHYLTASALAAHRGRSVSFHVTISPEGITTIAPLDDDPDADPNDPLAAARVRGRIRAAEILAGEDMLNADAFAKLIGTTRMTVNTKRRSGQILGLQGAVRGFRFPAWQVGRDGKPYPELKRLHELLGDPWAVWRFMTTPEPALRNRTGRQALANGHGGLALLAAEGIAQGAFS